MHLLHFMTVRNTHKRTFFCCTFVSRRDLTQINQLINKQKI